MKVTVERLPQRQAVLNIEAEPAEIEKSRRQAHQHLAQRARVPGFRQGKAPLPVIEQYVGKAVFMEEVLNHLLPDVTSQALEKESIEAVGTPRVELVNADQPVSWKATVDLTPEVDLGSYKDIRITPEPIVVDPAEVEKTLEQLRFAQAPWEPVDRESRMGDLLTADVFATESGRTVAQDRAVEYRLVEGAQAPMPGFPEQIAGVKKGERKEFVLSFPTEHERKDLAGKEFKFSVTVHEIKSKNLPALDDEFAKGVGDGFDSLEALRQHVTGQIRARVEAEAKTALQEKALDAVVAGAKLEYSPHLVEHDAEHLLEEQEDRLRRNRVNMDEYLASVGKTREQLIEELKPQAMRRVTRSLVMNKLQDVEKIAATEEEVQEELEGLVESAQDQNKDAFRRTFSSPSGRDTLRRSIVNRKTLNRLVEIVTQGAGAAPANKEASGAS